MIACLTHTNFLSTVNLDKKERQGTVILSFNGEHPLFKGHFPGNPIIAGAYQFELLKILGEKILDTKLDIAEIKKAKFLHLIQGGEQVKISVEIKESGELYSLNGKLEKNIDKNKKDVYNKLCTSCVLLLKNI